jgi:hypothetical protein
MFVSTSSWPACTLTKTFPITLSILVDASRAQSVLGDCLSPALGTSHRSWLARQGGRPLPETIQWQYQQLMWRGSGVPKGALGWNIIGLLVSSTRKQNGRSPPPGLMPSNSSSEDGVWSPAFVAPLQQILVAGIVQSFGYGMLQCTSSLQC